MDIVKWAKDQDLKAQQIVRSANDFSKFACTWHGRQLYWAILLAKYPTAMEAPEDVEEPHELCDETWVIRIILGG